ncbi:unnamed protein product [Cuscuta campestris]|uniref:Uncharacterized protein n=1 Tax=Cuscuta campestris TaxID=132261 RepID=A0A484NAU9_9ASTE|nr:unnamed protein product [Cuscuta campestris]
MLGEPYLSPHLLLLFNISGYTSFLGVLFHGMCVPPSLCSFSFFITCWVVVFLIFATFLSLIDVYYFILCI